MAANLLAHAGGLFACGIARRHGSQPAACDLTLLMQGCQVGQWPTSAAQLASDSLFTRSYYIECQSRL